MLLIIPLEKMRWKCESLKCDTEKVKDSVNVRKKVSNKTIFFFLVMYLCKNFCAETDDAITIERGWQSFVVATKKGGLSKNAENIKGWGSWQKMEEKNTIARHRKSITAEIFVHLFKSFPMLAHLNASVYCVNFAHFYHIPHPRGDFLLVTSHPFANFEHTRTPKYLLIRVNFEMRLP